MPTITIGRMSKKINSMRRTFDAGSTVNVSVKLKEKTTEHDPVFILQGLPLDNDYNYCQWGRRRYWINNKVYVTNDIMEFHCNLDPLATYHDSILDSTGYCSFADKTHSSDLLDDPRFGAEIELTEQPVTWLLPFADASETNWTVVIRAMIIAPDVIHGGGMTNSPTTYICDLERFYRLLPDIGDELLSGLTGNVANDVPNMIMKLIGGDPMDSILSVVALPMTLDEYKLRTTPDNMMASDYWIETTKMYLGDIGPINIGSEPDYKVYYNVNYDTIHPWIQTGDVKLEWFTGSENYRFLRYPKYTSLQLRYANGVKEINDNKLATNLKEIREGQFEERLNYKFVMNPFNGDYFFYILSGSEVDSGYAHEVLATVGGCCGLSLIDYIKVNENTLNVGDAITSISRRLPSTLASFAIPAGSSIATVSGGEKSILSKTASANPYDAQSTAMFTQRDINISQEPTTKEAQFFHNGIHGLLRPFEGQKGHGGDATFSNGAYCAYMQPMSGGPDGIRNRFAIVLSAVLPNIFVQENAQTHEIEFNDQNYSSYCEEYGWPCNKRLKLGDVGNTPSERGKDHYVKCEGFSWTPQNLVHPELSPLMPTAHDISSVNDMINSGIYITHDDLLE